MNQKCQRCGGPRCARHGCHACLAEMQRDGETLHKIFAGMLELGVDKAMADWVMNTHVLPAYMRKPGVVHYVS